METLPVPDCHTMQAGGKLFDTWPVPGVLFQTPRAKNWVLWLPEECRNRLGKWLVRRVLFWNEGAQHQPYDGVWTPCTMLHHVQISDIAEIERGYVHWKRPSGRHDQYKWSAVDERVPRGTPWLEPKRKLPQLDMDRIHFRID